MVDKQHFEFNYPPLEVTYNQQTDIHVFRSFCSDLIKGESKDDRYYLSGRVMSRREYGKSLIFLDIRGDSFNGSFETMSQESRIQCIISKKCLQPDSCLNMNEIKNTIGVGDLIMVYGNPHRSNGSAKNQDGEPSCMVGNLWLISPCLWKSRLPEKYDDVSQQERFRAMHYIVNPESKYPIILRSYLIKTLRQFLDNMGFLEVDTGVLCDDVGANAKPFTTHCLDMERDLKLRVAPELPLKKLVVGGFGKVYEIGPVFRNEGRDTTHNVEFTSCEFYLPMATVNDLMDITEQILYKLSQCVSNLKYPINPDINDINWSPPYKRLDIQTQLEMIYCEKVPVVLDLLKDFYVRHNISVEGVNTSSALKMYDHLIAINLEPNCRQPTFLYGHPSMMSPLAQSHDGTSHRFELFVGTAHGKTMELCNAYSELRDPVMQRHLFKQQSLAKEQGDDEVVEGDENYCQTLDIGLPATAGWGMGIDRAVMLLTGITSIQKVRSTTLHAK